jgi:hypothetical protein
MLGMMRIEVTTSSYAVEVPVERVEDVDAGVKLAVNTLMIHFNKYYFCSVFRDC